jgi:hypothetical protein
MLLMELKAGMGLIHRQRIYLMKGIPLPANTE